jgi:hypothetical protein
MGSVRGEYVLDNWLEDCRVKKQSLWCNWLDKRVFPEVNHISVFTYKILRKCLFFEFL